MRILVAVTSCHAHVERRRAVLGTWFSDEIQSPAGWTIDARLFLGLPPVHEVYIPSNDARIVVLECLDDYRNLSLKTRALVKFAIYYEYDFLFKCDDDTYVRLERLIFSDFGRADYIGSVAGRFCAGGAGYWISRRAMHIVEQGIIRPTGAEDDAVGTALAAKGILPIHDPRYQQGTAGATLAPFPGNDVITLHGCRPDDFSGPFPRPFTARNLGVPVLSMTEVHRRFRDGLARRS